MNGPGTQKVERDLKKLPRWARFRIEKAEEDVKFYKGMVENLQAGLLTEGVYKVDDRYEFTVRMGEDPRGKFLQVYGDDILLVEPRSANLIRIRLVDKR